jgi:hypothetical protein
MPEVRLYLCAMRNHPLLVLVVMAAAGTGLKVKRKADRSEDTELPPKEAAYLGFFRHN